MPRMRLRGPSGTSTISLAEDATVGDLQQAIRAQAKIETFELKLGYPPQTLELGSFEPAVKLCDTGLKLNGEQLIVNPAAPDVRKSTPQVPAQIPSNPASSRNTNSTDAVSTQREDTDSMGLGHSKSAKLSSPSKTLSSSEEGPRVPERHPDRPNGKSLRSDKDRELDTPPEIFLPAQSAKLVLRVMPDDNSCLFRALSSAFLGAEVDGATELRSIVASEIQSDSDKYSAVVLAQAPEDYCVWIQSSDSWGGAIEIEILSRYFATEVCSIDVQTGRIDRYLEGAPRRCIIVYSGVHYDVLALAPLESFGLDAEPAFDTKVFETSDDTVVTAAVELCDLLRQRHYFTDTTGFAVKCNTCGWQGTGEKDAVVHATKTGHYDFGET